MPVLESTDSKIAPKSILRHRPIESNVTSKGKGTQTMVVPVAQRASRAPEKETVDNVPEWQCATKTTGAQKEALPYTTRPSSSAGAAKTTRCFSQPPKHLSKQAKSRRWIERQAHPLLYLGLGMLVMLTLWMLLSTAFGWVTTTLDDVRYGRPRTYQTDAWVGHNEQTGYPSHFIALNLNRRIEIIEIAGGDPAHTHIYNGPQLYSADDDLAPVTLAFADLNGDHKPDMIVTFQGSRIIFINDHDMFRPMLPTERPQMEQALQHLRL